MDPEILLFSPQHHQNDSPPASSPLTSTSNRLKKPPPITPRRFNKFFTPRNSGNGTSSHGSRGLRDITKNGVNRHGGSVPTARLLEFNESLDTRPRKRTKASPLVDHTQNDLPSSPLRSSPCPDLSESAGVDDDPQSDVPDVQQYPLPIRRKTLPQPKLDWRSSTADFFNSHLDVHPCPVVPFCTVACNTNSLLAIGDEDGNIRIVDSDIESKEGFATPYLTFKPHENAIMGLTFSSDDSMLVTAAGDQTAHVIDMTTQQTIAVLAEHTASLKQVAFRPDNDQILATCSRDGMIGLWDLRCRNTRPVISLSSVVQDLYNREHDRIKFIGMSNSIVAEHQVGGYGSVRSRSSTLSRASPSVTSLAFLGSSRPHFLFTSTDNTSQVNLWDIRNCSKRGKRQTVPVSCSAPTYTGKTARSCGVTSLVVDSNSTRLYSVCRDDSIHVYSTNQLLRGSVDNAKENSRSGMSLPVNDAVAPLYALRHPHLHIDSFFVRAAMRRLSPTQSELLAVGCTEAQPVLFDTTPCLDEAQLPKNSELDRFDANMPYNTNGIPLFRGHNAEVTDVCWTAGGELITTSDDSTVRRWREDVLKERCSRYCEAANGSECGHEYVELDFDADECQKYIKWRQIRDRQIRLA